jgi:hypothetical protein
LANVADEIFTLLLKATSSPAGDFPHFPIIFGTPEQDSVTEVFSADDRRNVISFYSLTLLDLLVIPEDLHVNLSSVFYLSESES